MTFDSLLAVLGDAGVTLPLLGSLVSGALIGAEREFRGKPAGLRTHTLVSFASALLTIVGLRMAEWSAVLPAESQVVTDLARMPHAILTGIGFLGAGVIFREGASVHGLTTAASLWLTAALGIVFGTGLLELGVLGTATALVVLILLRVLQRVMPAKPVVRLKVAVTADSSFDFARLTAALRSQGLTPGPVSLEYDRRGGLRRYSLLAASQDEAIDGERLAQALRDDAEGQDLAVVPLDNEVADGA